LPSPVDAHEQVYYASKLGRLDIDV